MEHNIPERGFRVRKDLLSHPYLLLALGCILVNSLFSADAEQFVTGQGLFFLLFLAGGGALLYVCWFRRSDIITRSDFFFGLGMLVLAAIWALYFLICRQPLFYVLLSGMAALIVAAIYLYVRGSLTARNLVLLLAIGSFLLHMAYILYTPYYVRQQDSFALGQTEGHAAYIEFFVKGNFAIPDFDPRTRWQFYHPPLHHMLAALWVKINLAFGVAYEQAFENIQVLTLFYAGCTTILSYKIFKEFSLKRWGLLIPFAIVCFHPSLILLSGSINNDMLCLTFMMASILMAIRWYKNPRIRTILPVALCIGLAMMSKFSGALVAPAVAFLFLAKLIQERQDFWRYFRQFALFTLVCFPLGLWWEVYNSIRFGMPLSYVPMLSEDNWQYIGNYSRGQFFFDVNPEQFKSVFTAWGEYNNSTYFEHNVFISALKTSMFGEFTLTDINPDVALPAALLFYTNFALALSSVVALITMGFRKMKKVAVHLKIFVLVLYLSFLGSYLVFCVTYPHTCTQNFRYMVPAFVLGALAVGLLVNQVQNSKSRLARASVGIMAGLTGLFCIFSVWVYALLAITV